MRVPLDFYSVGPYTKLWKVDDTVKVPYRQPPAVRNRLLQVSSTANSARPEMWTLLGQESTFLAAPAAPVITPMPGGGVTAWGYTVTAVTAEGLETDASPTGSTTVGQAVLDVAHVNRVEWAEVPGAVSYSVYVVAGPNSFGFLANIPGTALDDTSGVGDGSILSPAANLTYGYRKLITFAPKAQIDIDFTLTDYKTKPPVLIDEVLQGADPANGEELKRLPEQYHETVLMDYVRRRLMSDEGDSREPLADADFRSNLRDAWCEENNGNLEAGALPPGFFEHSSQEDN
jgi:hypothetical protein